MSDTSIVVQWSELPCSDRNGEIRRYLVTYISYSPRHTSTFSVSDSNSVEVGGLVPRTTYKFYVGAHEAAASRSGTASTAIPSG
jgi:hypothetical protein